MKERVSKLQYYINIAKQVASRSTCLRRHYGCVIVKNDEIIATGYNGAARGETNCCDIYDVCPRSHMAHNSGDYSDCPAVHAEQNAMLSAARQQMLGATMYLVGFDAETGEHLDEVRPCPICARMIKNSGIKKLVYCEKTCIHEAYLANWKSSESITNADRTDPDIKGGITL